MILELIEEIRPDTGTMYAVVSDGLKVKWFTHKEDAEKFYDTILFDPMILKTQTNILKSQEIGVPLEEENKTNI